jgi:hypothetical protein
MSDPIEVSDGSDDLPKQIGTVIVESVVGPGHDLYQVLIENVFQDAFARPRYYVNRVQFSREDYLAIMQTSASDNGCDCASDQDDEPAPTEPS